MDDGIIAAIRSVIDLGMPALVIIQSIVLYRAHVAMTDRYLTHLEQCCAKETDTDTPQGVPI